MLHVGLLSSVVLGSVAMGLGLLLYLIRYDSTVRFAVAPAVSGSGIWSACGVHLPVPFGNSCGSHTLFLHLLLRPFTSTSSLFLGLLLRVSWRPHWPRPLRVLSMPGLRRLRLLVLRWA